MIRFECPHCGKPCEAPDELEGREAMCGRCKNRFIVPEPSIPVLLGPTEERENIRFLDALSRVGLVLGIAVSAVFLVYFLAGFGTSYFGTYNMGLMQDRLLGVLVSLSILILGIIMAFLRKW